MTRGTTQRDINAAERAKLALELRRKGQSLDEIAAACGYKDRSGAFHAIKRCLHDIPMEEAELLRKLEYLRLEHLERLCHQRIEHKDTKDPLWAVDRLVAIADRRSKLLGLDIPTNVEATSNKVVVREAPAGYFGEVKT